MTRRGFTAEELTVVMLLIAVAVLVVAVGAGRVATATARSASCMSNVKQIGTAMRMYATDNSGRMPPGPREFAGIYEYVKNVQLLQCPEDDDPEPAGDAGFGLVAPSPWEPAQYVELKSSYIMNPEVQTDGIPSTIMVGDDAPDRHPGPRWVGARLDGAAFLWRADEWEQKLGWVMSDDKSKRE